MSTGLLMILLIFMIGMSLIGSVFGVAGLGGNVPSPSQLASGDLGSYIQLVQALVPNFTGVFWFDLLIGILTVVVIIGGARIANPFGG